MYFPSPNVTDIPGFFNYTNTITSAGYGTSNPIPIMGFGIEALFFMILFFGLAGYNVSVENSFGAATFSTFILALLLYSFEILSGLGVVIPLVGTISSIFIMKR